jgi:hypothetical protein
VRPLSGNKELHEYLLALVVALNERGAAALSESVQRAADQAAGMSTEFLGEARIALRSLMEYPQATLTESERLELIDVLQQLDRALETREH